MDLIARVGEQEERVRVERDADDPELFVVTVGERVHRVRWAHVVGPTRRILLDGAQYEVAIERRRDGGYTVSSGGDEASVDVLDPLTALLESGAAGGARKRSREVRAYMPGRVVSVLVEEGSAVEAGQGLIVLEAMKMQNEIVADHAGVVKKIHVAAGDSVDGGAPLFEFE